jgi:integrase/recombinase XerD
MNELPVITLRHLMINGEKQIGMQFFASKVIHALIKTLNSPKWSQEYCMVYVINTPDNVNSIFKTFKGVAWINCRYFYRNKPVSTYAEAVDLTSLKNKYTPNKLACPPEYIALLETKRYSIQPSLIQCSFLSLWSFSKTKT